MKLLIAVDSAISTEVLVGAVGVRPWPDGTTAHGASVVVDADITEEVWREEGYGKATVRREMERRGEQITALAVERLKEVGIPAEVVADQGRPPPGHPFFRAEVVFGPDLRPRSRPQGLCALDAGQRRQSGRDGRPLHRSDRA